MIGKSQEEKLLFDLAEVKRQNALGGARHGYVKEVKEAGGERKMRVVMGIRPDGSEWLSPWLHADDHSGGGREQQLYEKGQNVTVNSQGGDFRQANVSPGPQSQSFPQPGHADKINGDTFHMGKLRKSSNKPQEDGGGSGGSSGGSGGSSGGGQSKSDQHFHEMWIAKDDQKAPQHQDQPSQPLGQSGGASSGQQGQQGQQSQSQAEAAMAMRVHEKNGITGVVGQGSDAARFSSHEKGAKIKHGDENWVVSSKNEQKVIVRSQEPPWVSDAWVIRKKKDPVPDDNDVAK